MTATTLVNAKFAAIQEVERLLQRSDDLKRLPNLLNQHAVKREAAKGQLASTLSSQIDAVRSGLEVLSNSQKTLSVMRDCYAVIDSLCTECANLIEHHDKIRVLSNVHYNLRKTLKDVHDIVSLPHGASSAEAMLENDEQLMKVYEDLSILEGMAMKAQKPTNALRHEDTHNLDFYFDKVKETMVKFEERLWSIIRNFLVLGSENPAMLVNAIRVVDLQEQVDAKLEESPNRIIEPKRYKSRTQQQIVMSIQDSFAPLLQACSQLSAAGENTDKRTKEILDQAEHFMSQLGDIDDYVTPCFPPSYNILNVIFRAYHEHMNFMLDSIGASSDYLANNEIVKVIKWVTRYQQEVRIKLNIEEEDLAFPAGPGSGTWLMTEKYISRVESILVAWYTNILEADLKTEPKSDDKGLLWTPGAVDFFRIVHEQMQVIVDASTGNMLLRSGQASLRVMRQFQDAQHAYISTGLSEEMLCAYINNNMRCYNESTEFADRMEDALDPAFKGRLDIETQCRGFLDLAKLATTKLADLIFQESALLDVFHLLYHTEEWTSGNATATILATLNDYFHDYERFIDSSNFKRLVEHCLHETVARYLAAMLTYVKTISEDLLAHMQKDNDIIIASFQDYMKPDKARHMVQALEDMRELAASDNVDTFVISYNSLLQVAPGIFPLLVERIIVARPDLLKADIREVMEQFKDVYLDRQKALGHVSPVLPKAKQISNIVKDRELMYKFSLESALKKPEPVTPLILTKYTA